MKKTLILGLGNPILTDDGIGIHVVRALAAKSLPPDVDCAEASIGGLRLLDILAGYERIVIVDAIQIPGGKPGELYPLHPDDVRASLHAGSTHDLTLPGALKLGRSLKMNLPEDRAIKIVAIQVEDVITLKEECTPAVKAAIPRAVNAVLAELERET
jgi:hydrogenase maturation protease